MLGTNNPISYIYILGEYHNTCLELVLLSLILFKVWHFGWIYWSFQLVLFSILFCSALCRSSWWCSRLWWWSCHIWRNVTRKPGYIWYPFTLISRSSCEFNSLVLTIYSSLCLSPVSYRRINSPSTGLLFYNFNIKGANPVATNSKMILPILHYKIMMAIVQNLD